ncbi:cytoskeleton protein RodZ [Candidatus Enterovibrio altilux]|uniref:cytoskeleton protein RodZ n=1 Tax=Candidatus Enterovibrio altilux TaxID=1927128 RepID=UPI001237C092|nr:cytoskeleton protein RodZ [Candidatus Enterovibrio luxaltus]
MNIEKNKEQLLNIETKHLGAMLKEAREALGLSAQDVANRLKLRASVIQELEDDFYDKKRIVTFTRGYIRSYAKLLGLNADLLLCNFQTAEEKEENSIQKMQSFSRKMRLEKQDSRVLGLTWFIFAVAVSLTILWWWQNQQNVPLPILPDAANIFVQKEGETENETNIVVNETDSDLVESQAIKNSVGVTSVVKSTAVIPSENITAITNNTNVVLSKPATAQTAESHRTPLVTKTETTTKTVLMPAIATTSKNQAANSFVPLTMTFSADCWVNVRDANGTRLVAGIQTAGETLTLFGKPPLKVILGAPSVVNLVYNNKKIDLSSYPPRLVVRLSLPK